jgi:hypothetical protein
MLYVFQPKRTYGTHTVCCLNSLHVLYKTLLANYLSIRHYIFVVRDSVFKNLQIRKELEDRLGYYHGPVSSCLQVGTAALRTDIISVNV